MNQLARLDGVALSLHGVVLYQTQSVHDDRGSLGVVYRADWALPLSVQWNLVASNANTLRGFHVHQHHADWLFAVGCQLSVGLLDMRLSSPTYRQSTVVDLTPFNGMLSIPPGVGHGFYNRGAATHCYATDEYWDPADEFACRWDDPQLGIDWQAEDPLLSERDRSAGSLAQMELLFAAATPTEPD